MIADTLRRLNFGKATLWSVGLNTSGQLGLDTTSPAYKTTLSKVSLSLAPKKISAAIYTSYLILSDDTLWSCGKNDYGQLGQGQTTTYLGTTFEQLGSSKWKVISGGYNHLLAIRADDTLWGAGRAADYQLANNSQAPQPSLVQIGSSTWKAIAAGSQHSLFILSDNTLWSAGSNLSYQTAQPDQFTLYRVPTKIGSSTWESIETSANHCAALRSDGSLYTWGYTQYGQCGLSELEEGLTYITTPTRLGSSTWLQVACGYYSTLGLRADGTLWVWGRNNYGQLGLGTTDADNHPTPYQIGSSTWLYIKTDLYDSYAIRADGTLWVCGRNRYGQLGLGTTGIVPSWTQLSGTGWQSLASGYHMLVIK